MSKIRIDHVLSIYSFFYFQFSFTVGTTAACGIYMTPAQIDLYAPKVLLVIYCNYHGA